MRFVPSEGKKDSKRRRSWWERFFFDDNDDGNWLGLREEDIVDEMSDEEKLETWKKRRAEVIVELREVQEEIGDNVDGDGSEDNSELDDLTGPERGFVKMVRDMVLGVEEEDTLYEEDKTVFLLMHLQNRQFFLAVLIVIPWALDFLARVMYSYALLDRLYHLQVAAKTLAVRRSQKLVMVKELHRKKARYRLEVGIGKSPHLSDDDLWLRGKALELAEEEVREPESICQHMDIRHGESISHHPCHRHFLGVPILNLEWETLLELIMEHYGLAVEQSTITDLHHFKPSQVHIDLRIDAA
ncbi:unnamed protein product [Brassica rapa subsp. narinosa]